MKNSNTNITIDKSMFFKARKCQRALWLAINQPHLKMVSPLLNTLFKKAKGVELTARGLFPDGYDVDAQQYQNFSDLVQYTQSLLNVDKRVIYGACFQSAVGRCRVDILLIDQNRLNLYRVKSSVRRDEEHILEVAYQTAIIKSAFPNVKVKSHIIYLNKEYRLGDDLNLKELFKIEDVSNSAKLAQTLVERYTQRAYKILKKKSQPDVEIGKHCDEPHECEFKNYCWKDLPEVSVFDIPRYFEGSKWNLFRQGIVRLEDIPGGLKLNNKQWIFVNSTVTGKPVVDPHSIETFLQDVEYPIHFMDFETNNPAIPVYAGTSPYKQIPFQHSTHTLMFSKAELKHQYFLSTTKDDPRPAFIRSLLKALGEKGTVFVYNKKFEEGRLKELASTYSEYKDAINNVIGRLKDLAIPFEKRYLYHPDQKGSYSIKKVLPCWVPNLSYQGMAIGNGSSVGEQYEKLISSETSKAEKEKIKNDLLEYCKLDTYAMVRLYQVLEKIVSIHQRKVSGYQKNAA